MSKELFTFSKNIPIKKPHDVIITGGGVAGVAAAVSAARHGASVLLTEKSNILGGLATLGLVNLFVPMCNGRGKQIIFGLAEKWLRESIKYGYDNLHEEWRDGEPTEYTQKRYRTVFSPYIFALQLTEAVSGAGIDILFDCNAVYPAMDGTHCRGVICDSKSGLEYYGCRVLIDTTGDADMLRRAGVPTVAGKNYFTYCGKKITLESCKKAAETGNIRNAFMPVKGGSINLYGDGQPPEMPRWSGLTVEEVTDYLIRNQRAMLDGVRGDERRSRDIAMIPMMPNFRTTCHLDGDYTFRFEDCYRHFDDSVCAINSFDHRDHLFEVPYRTLVRTGYDNMITAGRSASADGFGWDILRVIPPAILTGQAAGEAAVISLRSGAPIYAVDVPTLQSRLEEANVMIHFPDSYLPEDKTVCLRGREADPLHI